MTSPLSLQVRGETLEHQGQSIEVILDANISFGARKMIKRDHKLGGGLTSMILSNSDNGSSWANMDVISELKALSVPVGT